jgi:hypothetical protein
MIIKIYGLIWAFLAATVAVFYLMGNLTEFNIVVFGFIAFGMIFMGMIGVLPTMVSHPAPAKKQKAAAPAREKATEAFPAPAVHAR